MIATRPLVMEIAFQRLASISSRSQQFSILPVEDGAGQRPVIARWTALRYSVPSLTVGVR